MQSLREFREHNFLSVRDLATRAGVAPQTINRIETGKNVPKFSTARKIALVLDIEPYEVEEFKAAIDAARAGFGMRRTRTGARLDLTMYVYPDGHGNVIGRGDTNHPLNNVDEAGTFFQELWEEARSFAKDRRAVDDLSDVDSPEPNPTSNGTP